MQVFHSLCDTKKFYFWAESSLPPAAPASPKKKKDGDVFRPPGCLSFAPDNSPLADPAQLVRSFMDIAVDYLVRSSICDADILPSRRGRPAKSEKLSIQFLKSLQSINPNETVLDSTDRELSGFSDLLSSWKAALLPQAVDKGASCTALQHLG